MKPRSMWGFTVIEFLIAMSIMTIMVAVAVPYFSATVAARRLSSAAMRVGDDLRLMQGRAVSQGFLFCFHPGTDPAASKPGYYQLQQSNDNGATFTSTAGWYTISTDYTGITLTTVLDKNAVVVPRICFDSQGGVRNPTPRPPSAALPITFPLTLTVSNQSGTTKTVTLFSTGIVRVNP
jgi:Tfp pilus assembly protein FimT